MKKHTEKQPIDDLFARKLGNMSLPPSAGGFERLQARMGQNRPEARAVFWRNPAIQRYMAAAACLLLVGLFGWLYWPSGVETRPGGPQVATKQPVPVRPKNAAGQQSNLSTAQPSPEAADPNVPSQKMGTERLAKVERTSENKKHSNPSTTQPVKADVLQPEASVRNEPILTQTKPVEGKGNPDGITSNDVIVASRLTPEQVADRNTTVKPELPTERVLVVTIDEPASLVEGKQAAKTAVEEKSGATVNGKPETDTKAGGLWQQVKRIKHGEVFAQRDNADNDDRGLLDRAYNGLKHSFDKNKSTKQ